MKKYLKLVIIYCLAIMLPIRLLAEILKNTWFYSVGGYLIFLAVVVMLLHLGKLFQNTLIKRKYFIYISVIIGEVLFFQFLFAILNMSTVNTLLGIVGANIVFITFFKMLIDIEKIAKSANEKATRYLYYIAYACIMLVVLANVLVFIDIL